jgi:hypothetical protein
MSACSVQILKGSPVRNSDKFLGLWLQIFQVREENEKSLNLREHHKCNFLRLILGISISNFS